MEIAKRYIYEVTKSLPKNQRQDIGNELYGLIEDMINERFQHKQPSETDVKNILLELGPPNQMAQKYLDHSNYLVRPERYDSFIRVLKILFLSIIALLLAIFVVKIIVNPIDIVDHFVQLLISLIITIPMAVGWVIIGFMLAERFTQERLDDLTLNNKWDPAKLPPVPSANQKKQQRKAIVGIAIYLLLTIAFIFSNNYFGLWLFQDGSLLGVISFLHVESYDQLLLLILVLFGLGIIKESLKLVDGKWNPVLVRFTIIANLISLGLIVFILFTGNIWNPNFMSGLVKHGLVMEGSDGFNIVKVIWEQLTLWTIVLLIVGLLGEMVVGFIKMRKTNDKL